MGEVIGFLLNPVPGLTAFADAFLSLFPFGLYGVVFLGGMIVGERIGIWGILITVAGWIAVRFGTKAADVHEHVAGRDAAPPVPAPRPTIFKRRKK